MKKVNWSVREHSRLSRPGLPEVRQLWPWLGKVGGSVRRKRDPTVGDLDHSKLDVYWRYVSWLLDVYWRDVFENPMTTACCG